MRYFVLPRTTDRQIYFLYSIGFLNSFGVQKLPSPIPVLSHCIHLTSYVAYLSLTSMLELSTTVAQLALPWHAWYKAPNDAPSLVFIYPDFWQHAAYPHSPY